MADGIPDETAPEPARGVVEGIAIGRAVVWESDPAPQSVIGTIAQERIRLERAIRRATRGIEELIRLLPRAEAELFEPEIAILAELRPLLFAKVDAGVRPEDAVHEITSELAIDLSADARARLLDGLASGERSVESLLDGRHGDRVLVTENLTPSVAAALPARVVGIIAMEAPDSERHGHARASHAAILARGRDIPLAFASFEVVSAIANDDSVVLDTTVNPASVWPSASESTVSQARARREVWARARNDEQTQVTAPLAHLCVRVYVNVGSVHEHVPTWAEGIGLVRTELVFADRAGAPSEAEQFGALRAIASRVDGVPVVVRLFDAGGDKPLAWLRPPEGSTGARGIELLFMHPGILDAQLRAIGRTADRTDVRVLLPLVTGAGDVQRIRDRAGRPLPVGAMIETPAAVDQVDEIAEVSDFLCIGTNDLTAIVTGQRRVESGLSSDARVLGMIARVVEAGHRHGRKVTVCGEMAGEPHVARILVGLGVDSISVAPGRIAKVKLALRDVTMDDCRAVAREAMR